MKLEQALEEQYEERGNDHVGSSSDTPLREDAFVLSDEEKIERIQKSVREIMLTLGLDLDDDSLKGTPKRGTLCVDVVEGKGVGLFDTLRVGGAS